VTATREDIFKNQVMLAHYGKIGFETTDRMTFLELKNALHVLDEFKEQEKKQMEEAKDKAK
jgi:hypothetical protein